MQQCKRMHKCERMHVNKFFIFYFYTLHIKHRFKNIHVHIKHRFKNIYMYIHHNRGTGFSQSCYTKGIRDSLTVSSIEAGRCIACTMHYV